MKKVICRSIFVLLAVGGFAALAICIQLGVTQGFDEWVYSWVSQTITPVLTEFLKIITYAGDVFVIIGICVLLLIIPGTRKKVGIPARYFVSTLQSLFLAGNIPVVLVVNVLFLIASAVMFIGLTWLKTKRRLD